MTDTLENWRRALVLERINELCELTKDREFTFEMKELRDELIRQAIDAWAAGEFDDAYDSRDALPRRRPFTLAFMPYVERATLILFPGQTEA